MTEVLHFTIGADFGKLLMHIAQEHLLYNYSISKALNALSDLPSELQLEVLKGDYVMHVDENTQELLVGLRKEGIDDDYPRIDVADWYTRNSREIISSGLELNKAIDRQLLQMRFQRIHKSYDYSQILDFIAGNDKSILDDLWETEAVSELALLIDVTKRFIEKSMKILSVMDWMRKTYPQEFDGENLHVPDWREYNEVLYAVMQKFSDLLKCDFSKVQEEFEQLDNYIEATRKIDEILSKGIEPVNIMDNYSAGWLAPDGTFYGLNGEIANMLHNQIANALYEAGIMPESEENKVNPDPWLEQNGWIKIYGNNVHFAGCLNHQINKHDVDMTPKQIEIIKDYITNCHQCIIKAGWRMEKVSIGMFTMMAMTDLPALYKKYFEF